MSGKPEKVLYSQPASSSPCSTSSPHSYSPKVPRSAETITGIRIDSNQSIRGRTSDNNLSTYFDVVNLNESDDGYRRFGLNSFLSITPRAADELIPLLDAPRHDGPVPGYGRARAGQAGTG